MPCTGRRNANGNAIIVQGDSDELRTAVSNILDNAIKYSGANVDVSVRLETRAEENRVALRVRDRGIGIPEHELKRIFKRFYRVPRTSRFARERHGPGTCSSCAPSPARMAARCLPKAPASRAAPR